MRRLLRLLTLLFVGVQALACWPTCAWASEAKSTNAPPAQDTNSAGKTFGAARFVNGDTLRGELIAIDAAKRIQWRSPDITSPIEFFATNISSIRLPAASSSEPGQPVPANCYLRLVNNDEFNGRLVSMDADKLVLETWYAGPISFARNSVRWFRLTQGENFLYHGPTGLDGWTVSESAEPVDGERAWDYAKGVFFARRGGGIARDFKLPDRAAIDFDATWRDFLQLTITMYTGSLRVFHLGPRAVGGVIVNAPAQQGQAQQPPLQSQTGAGFYAMHLNYNAAYLMTVRKAGEIINSPVEMLTGLEQKNRVRFGIRADKNNKTISLLIDGKHIKTWQEQGEWAGLGTAVRFVQQGQAPLNISNIRVSPWDGSLEKSPIVGTNAPSATNDFVMLKNQDSLSGQVKAVDSGKLQVQTSFGELKIPLDRITQIDMAAPSSTTNTGPDAVRAYFAGGGSITFKLEEWTDKAVVAGSPYFGKARFNPAAFASIEFNLPKTQ